MATLFVRQHVADYTAWRRAYDAFAPMQKKGGVIEESVYQAFDDPTDVTVTHEFATIEAAQAFAGSADLREAMQAAGLVGAPTIWFANRV